MDHVARVPSLSSIRPVRTAQATLTAKLTWALERLGVDQLWKQGLTGEGVAVGHLDTGVDASHPALKGRVAEFAEWNFMGAKVANSKPHDSDVHGTHTAGTICGVAVQGRPVGVAPGATLCSGLAIEGGDWVSGLYPRFHEVGRHPGQPEYCAGFCHRKRRTEYQQIAGKLSSFASRWCIRRARPYSDLQRKPAFQPEG